MTNIKSKSKTKQELEIIKCVFEQNYQHIRHIENERLWFTNLYAVVVAGILAYLGQKGFAVTDYLYRSLLVFLLMFSILGFIIAYKFFAEFNIHIEKIKKILNETKVEEYMGLPLEIGVWRYFRVGYAFCAFYVISVILWLYLLATAFFIQ